MTPVVGIQGHLLEVTVVKCNSLKDTEWITRQNPYVCIDYGTFKFKSSICQGGDRNPTFQDKIFITLIEGLREIDVAVWNSHGVFFDNLIGSGKVRLVKVLSEGFDESAWPIQTKSGRYAGEVCLIMRYVKPMPYCAPSEPTPPPAQPGLYPRVDPPQQYPPRQY